MDRVILLQFGGSVNVLTMNPNPYWVTASRGSPTSRAPLKVSIWCTQTRLTASPPHMYDNVYLHVAYVYMSSIFSLINKYRKFASYLAAIRDRWGPRYGPKHNLQARPRSMDGHASTHLLLHSGVTLSCPCGALVWWAAHCCRATRGNESEFAQVLLIKESDNKKRCVIQPWRRIHQLSTVATFARRWVTDTMDTCFVLFLIYHWWWILWWMNSRLKYFIGEDSFLSYVKRRICR
jgi:hypothetical protein